MPDFKYSYACIIGINQYQNSIAKLNTAKPDAETLADILKDDYQYQVELITDDTERKPTRNELENLLTKWLPEQLQPPAENNRLLFYFAGHGMPLESDDGPRGFLLPQDANPNPKPGESNNFLSMQVLHDALIALPCHHLIVILDCCFAGTFRWASTRKLIPIPETIRREHYDRFIRYPAWQVITSAAHNQEALDFLSDKRGISKKSQGKKHSPFAEALFEALQDGEPDEKGRRYKKADLTKDGVITAPELYLYLRDNVETRSGDRQTPGLYPLKKHDRGEYIFHDPNFDPQSLSKADPIDETNNPYRGLKPFEEEHARFFFGRQELIESLSARIAAPDHSLNVVLGVSGSGKSSLVKAGLIPYLRELSKPNKDRNQWHILNPIRPGESPFAALARTIWAIADLPTIVQLDSLGFLSQRLNQKIAELQTKIAEASRKHGETSLNTQRLQQEAQKFTQIIATWNQDNQTAKQLLIVEHFETLYALCSTKTEPESQQQQQLKQVFLACLNPLIARLQSAPNSFVEIVKAWSQKHSNIKLLLVIDQFEELITLGRKAQPNQPSDTPKEWQQFLELLETTLAVTLPQLRIIVTLRSDFEPRFLNSEALKPYWTKARFPVRAMRSDELREAIARPASEMALYFEPANLVDRLIDEVGQMPGALPLLSFTLSELYIKLVQKWRNKETSDRALTIDASFDKEGGIAGSLTRRANEEYQKIGDELGEAVQITMRRVMLRMLTLEGGEAARRRVPESELEYSTKQESDRVQQVVDRLVEARLLVKGQLETGEPYVEPAHDFLVRGWGTLQNWIDEQKAQETLELQQRLTAQANDWARNQGPLLPNGERLNRLEIILRETDKWLNLRETEFVQESINERERQRSQVRELRARAKQRERVNRAQQIAAQSQAIRQSQPQLSLLLAAEAPRVLRPDDPRVPQMEQALRDSLAYIGGRGLKNHSNQVIAIALSPNNHWLATGSYDGKVVISDLEAKDPAQTAIVLEASPDFVSLVSFSPDNRWLVTAGGTQGGGVLRSSNHTAILWDLVNKTESLIPRTVLQGHQDAVSAVAFSPDGLWLATGDGEGSIRVWSLGSLTAPPLLLNKHQELVSVIVFGSDSHKLVSASRDGTAHLWDLSSTTPNEPVKTLPGGNEGVTPVGISPNLRWLVVAKATGSNRTVQLFDLSSETFPAPVKTLPLTDSPTFGIVFSPDSRWFVTLPQSVSDFGSFEFRTACLWELSDVSSLYQPFAVLPGHRGAIYAATFTPDSQKLVTVGADRTVQLRNLTNADSVTAPISLPAHDDKILAVAVSDRWLVTGGADKIARFWNLTVPDFSASPIVFNKPKSHVRFVASSHDGRWLAAGGDDTDVYLWEMQADTHVKSFWRVQFHNKRICGIAFDEVKNRLVVSSEDGSTSLWDLSSNFTEPTYILTSMAKDVSALAVSPQGSWVATGSSDGIVGLWNPDTEDASQALRLLPGHTSQITAIAFSHDDRWLITGDEDGKAILWNLAAPKPSSNLFELSEHTARITSVAFSTDHHWVVTGSWDNRALLWDLTNPNPTIAWMELGKHGENVYQVAISPNNHWLITASEDSVVRLWNLQAQDPFQQMIELRDHLSPVRAIAVSADSHWLVSSDLDGKVLLWDLKSADPSTVPPINLPGHTKAVVALTIGGSWIASGSWDDTARLWHLTLNELRELAWYTAGRHLSNDERRNYLQTEDLEDTSI